MKAQVRATVRRGHICLRASVDFPVARNFALPNCAGRGVRKTREAVSELHITTVMWSSTWQSFSIPDAIISAS